MKEMFFNIIEEKKLEGFVVVITDKNGDTKELIDSIISSMDDNVVFISNNSFFLSSYAFPNMTDVSYEKAKDEVLLLLKDNSTNTLFKFDSKLKPSEKLVVLYSLESNKEEYEAYKDDKDIDVELYNYIIISTEDFVLEYQGMEDSTNLLAGNILDNLGFCEEMESTLSHSDTSLTEKEIVDLVEKDNPYVLFVRDDYFYH